MKINDAETSKAKRFFNGLSGKIEGKCQDIKRVTSIQLVTLFWQIGSRLNQYTEENLNSKNSKHFIQNVSALLAKTYGPFFDVTELKRMREFASQFQDFATVEKIIPFIDWAHILELLRVEDFDLKLFYVSRILKENLSAPNLRKHILTDLSAHKKNTKHKNDKKSSASSPDKKKQPDKKVSQIYQLGIKQIIANKTVLQNPFRKTALPLLRTLLEHKEPPVKRKLMLEIQEKPISEIGYIIEEYISQQNRRINTKLNLCFWEIGNEINKAANAKHGDVNYKRAVIRDASLQLQKRYRRLFKEKDLEQMAAFAMKFADIKTAIYISRHASWQQILILVPLQTFEEIIFYLHLTVEQALNTTQLQRAITKNTYDNTDGKKIAEKIISQLQNPTIKTVTKKTQKNELVIDEIFIPNITEENNQDADINIFESPFLALLA